MKLKNLILVALLLIVPLSSSGSVKIRYPLNEWNTEPFWQSNTVTGPDGEIYNAPKDTAINSYFDHDGYGNKTAKNFSCTSGYPYDRHSGIDFRTGVLSTTSPGIFQTPVLAVAPGKVVLTEAYCDQTGYIGNGCGGGLGNHIVLEHDADTRTVYGHLYSLDGATSGSQVACSQRIGTVGKSGNADEKTGVHLHFGLKVKDTITGVWENRDPYGSPKNTNGSSCPGYTGPAYPSYWYKMENGSTERPSIQCQSTKPLATSLINVQKHESQNYTYLEIEDNYSSNLVDLSFVQFSVERKFNNGPWANPLPQELNNVTGSTTKIFSLPGGPVVEQGNYCYRVRAYSPATKEYSSFSNEKCIQITGDNVATNSSLDQKPIIEVGYYVGSDTVSMKVSLQHAVFGDHVNKTVVTERVDATNGYLESDWKQVSTSQITQNISLVHSELVSVFSKRLCYRVKVKKADTNEPYTIYSDAKCAYAGNNSSKTFPPTNLRVTAQGTATDPEIKIMFDDNARGETYFAIVRNEQGKTPEAYQVTGVAGDASDHVLFDRNSEPPTPINEQYYSNSSTSKLKPGTNYCYKLKTSYVSSQGSTPQYSPFSNEACTTTLGTSTTPPTTLTPPTNLTTPTLGPTALILTWIDTTTTETGFDVERKTGTSGTYTKLSQSPAKSGSGSTGSYISSGLTPSTLYCYRVRAVQNTTYSAYTPDYCITTKPATTVTPPSIPTNLSVTLPTTNPSTTLNISFKDTSTNETGFEIERKTGAGGTYTQLTTLPLSAGSGTTPTYTSTLLSPSTTYCYRVRALGTTNSAYTADVCTTTAATPSSTLPTPPTSLTVTNPTTNPATSLQISWKDNSTNETGFDLRRKVGPATSSNPIAGLNQQSKAGSGSTITITSTGLTTKTQYCYQIAAKPTTAQSVYTPWVCGVTK